MKLVINLVLLVWIIQALQIAGQPIENSKFSAITRKRLLQCPDVNPFLKLTLDTSGPLMNVHNVKVTVSGIVQPSDQDWIGAFTQATHDYTDCPENKALYLLTGDTSDLPLLCDYPLKFKFVSDDPGYLTCNSSTCIDKACSFKTCSGSIFFRLINVRTSITFVFFRWGLTLPCILKISEPLSFATPEAPLYGHISAADSSATSMILTWISGDSDPQYAEYTGGSRVQAEVTSFTKNDMCDAIASPANDFGWHQPGFVHVAKLNKLSPSTTYTYRYGSDMVGWSTSKIFTSPPAAGSSKLTFAVFGDMGKAERDNSLEHYIQPGSLQVIDALKKELIDAVFHIGDISYATGFLAEWDHFLEMIEPVASRLPYMTAIGNHERDFPSSGSKYITPDSGGECGVPYGKYFQMPVQEFDKPWYSIEMGPVHFTVMSSEHDWTPSSEQYEWLSEDLAAVNRSRTPWLIFTGHRPMYSSASDSNLISKLLPLVDPSFPPAIEPLLSKSKVDLALWGHVHNYERTCGVYRGRCVSQPVKDSSGVDTYNTGVSATVHAVVGMAGFALQPFSENANEWSLVRISEFGYAKVTADKQQLLFEFIVAGTGTPGDRFKMVKN